MSQSYVKRLMAESLEISDMAEQKVYTNRIYSRHHQRSSKQLGQTQFLSIDQRQLKSVVAETSLEAGTGESFVIH
uniref:Transposase n=1 Tax=Panagrellus redivivus TaxID=6233 RepID=A0A7E4URY1_PANRE